VWWQGAAAIVSIFLSLKGVAEIYGETTSKIEKENAKAKRCNRTLKRTNQ